jgi:site-specific recombinase XerD
MLNDFKNWLILNGASQNTTDNYESRILEVHRHTPIEKWTKEALEAFLTQIKLKRKTSTFNNYLFAIKKYLAFIKKDIELPHATRIINALPKCFTEKYFEDTIIMTIEQIVDKDIEKIKALLYFLFYTGIRIGEIDTLHRKDIDLDKFTAKIYVSKTREERMVFFTKQTKFYLEQYFNCEEEQSNAFNMTSNAFQARINLWKPYFRDVPFHAHMFRHSFATNLLYKGVDLFSVSKLLGHKDIATTQRYLSLSTEQIQELYNSKIDKKRKSQ